MSGAWAAPSSRLGLRLWEADAPWRQRHLVTRLQIRTSLGERDALVTFLVSGKRKALGSKLQSPWLQSLSSLTFQLQIRGSCLPARAGSGKEALAEAPCSCPGSNLPFAECFLIDSASSWQVSFSILLPVLHPPCVSAISV